MKIHFHGAAHEVTGSKHLLEINGQRILLDCGLFQGHRKEADDLNKSLPFDPKTIDAMILSHAHIDHCGNIPSLAKHGYRGKVFCTHATKDVAKLMLLDSAHIQEKDAEFFQKHRNQLQPAIEPEPLYTRADAELANTLLTGREYHERFEVIPDSEIYATFLDAAHILGSAITILEFPEDGRTKRLVFTGDLGRSGKNILSDFEIPDWTDYLITESTYGNRSHDPFSEMIGELERVINETSRKGGKIIIPSFALERTQELIYDLYILYKQQRIPSIPVFVDSPLATNVTKIFEDHPEAFSEESQEHFLNDRESPFSFRTLRYTESVEDSKKLNHFQGPCVIISASGMCEFGRIRHHLSNSIENPNNTVLIVGYQAEHTLGRRIVERRPVVKIFGEMYKLRANVEVLNGYSGHGDQDDLLKFVSSIDRTSHVFIVHGEISQSTGLAKKLRHLRDNWTIDIPERGDVINPEEISYVREE